MNLKEHREKWLCNMHAFLWVRSLFNKSSRNIVLSKNWVSSGRPVCRLR